MEIETFISKLEELCLKSENIILNLDQDKPCLEIPGERTRIDQFPKSVY